MSRLAIAICMLLATGCANSENVGFYGGVGKIWVLTSIDGVPATVRSDLRIGHSGALSGQTGCNSWQAQDTSIYPWFDVEVITATLAVCPYQAAERAFFEALKNMTIAEGVGETLILSTVEGREMVFNAAPAEQASQ